MRFYNESSRNLRTVLDYRRRPLRGLVVDRIIPSLRGSTLTLLKRGSMAVVWRVVSHWRTGDRRLQAAADTERASGVLSRGAGPRLF